MTRETVSSLAIAGDVYLQRVRFSCSLPLVMRGWFGLVFRNAARSPLRGALTIVAVAVSLVAFLLVRAINSGWTAQVEETPDNRVVTRHKRGFGGRLPVRYVEVVRQFPEVRRVTGVSWGMLTLPQERRRNFGSVAVHAEYFVPMHYELQATDAARNAFLENRRGAFVSQQLAEMQGWSPGDVIHFKHAKIPGTVELVVSGIFLSQRAGFAERNLYFHWEYFNELLPVVDKDFVNIIAAEIFDPSQGARLSTAIDIEFDKHEGQTFTQEDQALNAQLVGQFGAILTALNIVGYLMLGIVLLVLSNTLAMIVRERSSEYGAMRAIGFLRKHLVALVVGEAAVLGFAGGLVSCVLAFPLVQGAASAYLEREMNFDPLTVSVNSGLLAIALGTVLGGISGAVPGLRLARRSVAESLRRVA